MKFIILTLILIFSIFSHAKDENFTQLPGNKYANGDTVKIKQVTVNKNGKPAYYTGCTGLVYGSKSESNLWKSDRELDVEREYFIQIQCDSVSPIYHQWVNENEIEKIIKKKQVRLPAKEG